MRSGPAAVRLVLPEETETGEREVSGPARPHAQGPTKLSESLLLVATVAVDLLAWNAQSSRSGEGPAAVWVIPVVSTAVLTTLLLRHRFPAAVLIVQLCWATVAGHLFDAYTPIVGTLLALYPVARGLPARRSLPWWALCAVPYAMFAAHQSDGVSRQATALLFYLLLAGAAWLLGYRAWLFDRQTAERKAAEQAIRAERLRIARDLHDIVAHAVSVMMIQSAGARAVMTIDPLRAETALDVVQDVGRQSVNELRRLLGLLRSASADGDGTSIEQQPGLGDIETLLANADGTDLTVHGTPGSLDPSVGLTAYRLVQESLTNSLKHAGPDVPVHVDLAWTTDNLTISVRNDAPPPGRRTTGQAPLSTGLGLIGLRERVLAVGGTLETGTTPAGFSVRGVLPVAAQPAPAATASPEPERIIS
jgi:signal transduction histidine kinase